MSSKLYTPPDTKITDKTEKLDRYPTEIATLDLLPRIAERNRNAVQVSPFEWYFYQRIRGGRRCSCWEIEDSPEGYCPVCWGTGTVGGFEKYGTRSEYLDVTKQEQSLTNVIPNYDRQSRPVRYTLVKDATFGIINFEVPLQRNTRQLDTFQIRHSSKNGTLVRAYVKSPTETEYVQVNHESLQQRLEQQKLQFRVVLMRATPETVMPSFSHLMFRYKLFADNKVKADIPIVIDSQTLAEFGVFDSFSSLNMYLDNTLPRVTNEDFFVSLFDDNRWKVIEVRKNSPSGILLSWECTVRKAQNFENYAIVP